MKLSALISVWGDCSELLPTCISSAKEWADDIIVVWSKKSNKGENYIWPDDLPPIGDNGEVYFQLEPDEYKDAHKNETEKRNWVLQRAKWNLATHFIMMDADEFYVKHEMEVEKERIERNNLNGVVHPLKVYVGKPTLWCEDHTIVPGIQKLYPDTQFGNFKNYPFAYDAQGQAHIDPTRRTNQTKGIEMSPFYMHHMSYVRRDIDLKIRNSSANLRRSEAAIKRDIANAAPGYMSELYHRELKECENLFNITI